MATREDWERRVKGWRRSGLTSRAYGSQHGLNANTLLYWSSRLQRESRPAEFVEVTCALDEETPIEIQLPNGRVVRVSGAFEEAALQRVLSAAEG